MVPTAWEALWTRDNLSTMRSDMCVHMGVIERHERARDDTERGIRTPQRPSTPIVLGMITTPLDERTPAPRIVSSVDADDFRSIFRGHPGGIALIAADPGSGPVALTVSSLASVSVDPPVLSFSLSGASSASPAIAVARTVVVHLLDEQDIDLARLGVTSGIDRFADTSIWTRLATGEPVFPGARAWLRCVIVDRMHVGDSSVIAARALQHHVSRPTGTGDGDALVYHDRAWHRLSAHSVLG